MPGRNIRTGHSPGMLSDPFITPTRVQTCWAGKNMPGACKSDGQYEILTNYPSTVMGEHDPGPEVWAAYCPRHLTVGLRTWCLESGAHEVRVRLSWGLRVHLEVNPSARDELRLPNGEAVKHSTIPECQHRDENNERDCPKPAKDGALCDGHAHEENRRLENIRQQAMRLREDEWQKGKSPQPAERDKRRRRGRPPRNGQPRPPQQQPPAPRQPLPPFRPPKPHADMIMPDEIMFPPQPPRRGRPPKNRPQNY